MRFLFFILIFLITANLYAEDKLPVMLKVKSDFNLSNKIINTFRSGAEDSLTAQAYSLISKEQQEEALEQQAEQQKSDCYDDACLVTTGRMMAAQMIFIISISKMENEYIFKARLVDLETGATKRTVTKIYKGRLSSASNLLKFAKELTNEALGIKKKEKEEVVNYTVNPNINIADLIKMEFYSTPSKAKVYIDGKFIGKTPAQAKIIKGKHKFKLVLSDYEEHIFESEVYIDKVERINLKSKYAYINIKTIPKNAEIYIDKKLIGKSPTVARILKKKHKVEIYLKNFERYSLERDFHDTRNISVKLKLICDKDNIEYCNEFAKLYYLGKGRKINFSKSFKIFEKTCKLESSTGCLFLGISYILGQGIAKNTSKGKQIYKKGLDMAQKNCLLNKKEDCYALADVYKSGIYSRKDILKANELYKKACKLGLKLACEEVSKYKKLKKLKIKKEKKILEKKKRKEKEIARKQRQRKIRIENNLAKQRGLSNSWMSPMLVVHDDLFMLGFELLHVRWKYAQMGYLSMYGDLSQYKVFGFTAVSAGFKFFPDSSNRHKIGFTVALGAEFGDKDESVVPIEISYRYSHNMKLYAEIGIMTFLYTTDKIKDGEYGEPKYFDKFNFFIRIGFWGSMD